MQSIGDLDEATFDGADAAHSLTLWSDGEVAALNVSSPLTVITTEQFTTIIVIQIAADAE